MSLESARPRGRPVSKEVINIVGTALAVFLAVFMGSLLVSVIPPERESVWFTAGAFLTPGAAMFALYWLIAQRY
jgi:membrane protein DedA with SNARE-associated domain